MTPESDILHAVRLAVGALPYVRLWRNNVGEARYPKRGGGFSCVRYGLTPGSSDLIGVLRREDGAGLFLAIEVKSARGHVEPAQDSFLALVRQFGGVAAVVQSPAEALAIVAAARIAPPQPRSGP